MDVPLSVLDLAPVGRGFTPAGALRASLELVQLVERLGYHRYWVAEHHNMPSIASSSPAVLLAHAASVTSTIRIGSGGVMLPNHAPLVVAEQFGMLEALHPGRVDLGIGRAPGTDRVTMHALRRTVDESVEDFPRNLGELLAFFDGEFPEGHPYRSITATPAKGYRPAVWLLGSSDFSARLAGYLGLPFSFAHHFSATNTLPAVTAYRESFQPSAVLAEPYLMVAANVLCAESEEQARWLAGPSTLGILRRRMGRPTDGVTPEEAAAYQFTPQEKELVKALTAGHVVGAAGSVRAGLEDLVARTGADEIMVSTMAPTPADRRHSLELVAESWDLTPPA